MAYRITLIIPTFRRTDDLRRCLGAVSRQRRPADQTVVCVRHDDAESIAVVEANGLPDLRPAVSREPGVVAAMNAGLAAASGDVIALTDDDAAPHADWLERIEAHFAADVAGTLGGVGGRDDQYKPDATGRIVRDEGSEAIVGRLQWFGRVVGNHHHAAPGPPREVELLKGVNCAFRAEPLKRIGFDRRLWGPGAQVHWELGLCLTLRREGWRLVFDPAVAVDHFNSVRYDGDCRGSFNPPAMRDATHNETLLLLEHLRGPRRWAYRAWAAGVGSRGSPGLLQAARLRLNGDPEAFAKWSMSAAGRREAIRTLRSSSGETTSGRAPAGSAAAGSAVGEPT